MTTMIPAWVDGRLTPVDKLHAHKAGLKHKAVSVFVMRGEDILIQRRAMGKYHTPGLWANTCCTHPGWDEDPADCAVRRLREELGVTGLRPEFRQRLEYKAPVGGGMIEHEAVDVFLARVVDAPELRPNPEEVMDTRWIGFDDLHGEVAARPLCFTPWLRIYLDLHSHTIFGPGLAGAGSA